MRARIMSMPYLYYPPPSHYATNAVLQSSYTPYVYILNDTFKHHTAFSISLVSWCSLPMLSFAILRSQLSPLRAYGNLTSSISSPNVLLSAPTDTTSSPSIIPTLIHLYLRIVQGAYCLSLCPLTSTYRYSILLLHCLVIT